MWLFSDILVYCMSGYRTTCITYTRGCLHIRRSAFISLLLSYQWVDLINELMVAIDESGHFHPQHNLVNAMANVSSAISAVHVQDVPIHNAGPLANACLLNPRVTSGKKKPGSRLRCENGVLAFAMPILLVDGR
jgi:hypothetical protein